ncbi:MAG: DUF1501 domain-containing protein [Planctomycetes bacterium]|nr:DUF1501 domain-containing protein [Planctomycetota bacterium]
MTANRREFLKGSFELAGLISLSPAVPAFLWRTARAQAAFGTAAASDQTVLIVLQLTGGNDGLNTVIPYENDAYAKARPTIRFTRREVHRIGRTGLGFHPRMKAFLRLLDEQMLTVVQGVGYPNSKREHAAAMRDWQTASPQNDETQTGWLGRAADQIASERIGEVPATFVSNIAFPMALRAKDAIVPAIRSLKDWTFRPLPGQPANSQRDFLEHVTRATSEPLGDAGKAADNPLLELVRRQTLSACTVGRRLEAVAERRPRANVVYPNFGLAERLRTIADLIRADLGTRIFFTELGGGDFGGFDNHANQRGNHGALLHQLAESVAAFLDDLKRDRLADRVVLMTFSEFGRTVAENGRRGTDHGAAAPVFLAGAALRGGLVGDHPSLTDLDNNALRHHTDFRQVYATMLDRWLGIDSQTVLGRRFPSLDLFRS